MDSLFEKITLYDILGYLLPGCVFMLLLPAEIIENLLPEATEKFAESGMITFAFFVVSYVAGILLSEITSGIVWVKRKLIKRLGKCTAQKQLKNTGIGIEDIVAALKKSGLKEDEAGIREEIQKNGIGSYMSYMYGIVQCSAEHKRIHNYASAYVLYKNMAGALVLGSLIACVSAVISNAEISFGAFVTWCILGILLLKRGLRFGKKKNDYSVIWFVEKEK